MGCVWSQSTTLTTTIDDDPSYASNKPLQEPTRVLINEDQIDIDRNISTGVSSERVQTELSCNTPPDNTLVVEHVASDVIFTSKSTAEDIFNKYQHGGGINFDSLVMVNSIRAVLRRQLITSESLLELFQIYDKDGDGWLQLSEFIEFVEIIDLSYGNLLPQSNSPSRRSSKPLRRITYKGPVETLTPYHSVSSMEDIGGFTASNDYDDDSEAKVSVATASSVHYVTSPGSESSTAETRMQSSSDDRSKTQFKREYRKFPLLEPRADTAAAAAQPQSTPPSSSTTTSAERNARTEQLAALQARNLSTPPTRSSAHDNAAAMAMAMAEATGIPSPSGKKGFMVQQEEKSDGSPTAARVNRFFTLNDGSLTYYDSTTKTPPFSLDRRTIPLSGMSVTVVGETFLQLRRGDLTSSSSDSSAGNSPLSISAGIFSPSRDRREVLSLEIKSSRERDDWIRAIQAHIDFSTTLDRDRGRDSREMLLQQQRQQQYELCSGSSRSEVDVA